MSRSQNKFIKNQREKKKAQKKKQKEQRRKERQENKTKGDDLSNMMAYVDEHGNITSEPPEEDKPDETIKKDKSEDRKL
jgi:hypothetical protein